MNYKCTAVGVFQSLKEQKNMFDTRCDLQSSIVLIEVQTWNMYMYVQCSYCSTSRHFIRSWQSECLRLLSESALPTLVSSIC